MESKEKQQIIIISDIIKFWNFIENLEINIRITKDKKIISGDDVIAMYVKNIPSGTTKNNESK